MEGVVEFFMYILTEFGLMALITTFLFSAFPLIIIGLLVLYFSKVGKILDENTAKMLTTNHKKGNKIRRLFEESIKDQLLDLAKISCADRAVILEYSNGTSNLVGVPFLYATATAEVVTPGTSAISTQYQRIPLNLFSGFIYRIERNGFTLIKDLDTLQCQYPVLYKMLKDNEVNEIAFAPIQGKDEVVGLIIVSTIKENRLWDKYLESGLSKFASKISILFAFEKNEEDNEKKS